METTEKSNVYSELKLIKNSFDIYTNAGSYINQERIFHAYFKAIPNVKIISALDLTILRKWIFEEMENEINLKHYKQIYSRYKKVNYYESLFIFLKNGLVLSFYDSYLYILFLPKDEIIAQEFQNLILRFQVKPKKTTKISLIVKSASGLTTRGIFLKKLKLNIDIYYNDDFKDIHNMVLKNIKKPNAKGLYLFHGLPGTGKSTYIKYLIHQQKKKVIFLSPSMAGNLDNVELTNFLLDNKNCVLVIEDAEELILSRDNSHNSKLSFLLNLTDGLLGESLGIQIIATFNTDLKNIDKALLRKGRLTAIYEFKGLEVSKTNALLNQLGHDIEVEKSMVLSDIFNFSVDTNYKTKLRKAVGFGN